MIRINRGPTPLELEQVRQEELQRVRQIAAQRSPTSSDIGRGYAVVLDHLFQLQHGKCCYCEVQLSEPPYNDVEHYRPKARADRKPGSMERHGYWWLAWSWENLLFACPRCNRTHKRDQFPLANGSSALLPEELPPGNEHPLLIDPGNEDPMVHIEFYEEVLPQRRRWHPRGRAGSERGQATIHCLKLHRSVLLDEYTRHVNRFVSAHLGRIRGALSSPHRGLLQLSWSEALEFLFSPDMPHHALTYDILDREFPEEIRAEYGLSLPRPQVRVIPPPPENV